MYGNNASSPALKEEHGTRVFKNRLLQKIPGPNGEEAKSRYSYINKSLTSRSPHKIFQDYQIKNFDLGEMSGIYGGGEMKRVLARKP